MAPILKKYWWLVLLVIAVLILKLFPDKLPFLEKIERSKTNTPSSMSVSDGRPALGDNFELHPNNRVSYLAVTSVKYTVKSPATFTMDGEAFEPKVSPDGSKIIFIIKSSNKAKLAVADLQKGDITPIDTNIDNVANPAWDPEGNKIVFIGMSGSSSEIFTYEMGTKKLFQVTNDKSRKKYWPRFSPFMFNQQYRIAYSSEEKRRKDIWWVRANGENDMPLTFSPENLKLYQSEKKSIWDDIGNAGVPGRLPTEGGDFPEWSPNGFLIIYKMQNNNYNAISYSYDSWWVPSKMQLMTKPKGLLTYAPNQASLLEYISSENKANRINVGKTTRTSILTGKELTSMPCYFPDGKALAFTHLLNGKNVLSIEPFEDSLGDIVNLWMYKYDDNQQDKLTKNQLLFLHSSNDRIYNIYETEFYAVCGGPDSTEHARPYLVTSDAVLETFYAAFSALLSYTERTEFVQALTDFASHGYETAKTKKLPEDVQNFFLIGLTLLKPGENTALPAKVTEEIIKIKSAKGFGDSLFEQRLNYDEFLVRGKYERDKDLQKYFRALKWFQVFKFDLKKEQDRALVTALLELLKEPAVYKPLEKINARLEANIGQSRYYGPSTLIKLSGDGNLPEVKSSLPWLTVKDSFQLFPSIYTLDSFIFDELITHTNRLDTVGTGDVPRLLPVGLDIMASFGSKEARSILLDEMKENRFHNYEYKLDAVAQRLAAFPPNVWDSNLYHAWLGMLDALVNKLPSNTPEFTESKAWKRKNLSTALGSWVNLRYETVAYVENVVAECGEAGYESVIVGLPKGYVEPNPEFFKRLNVGFGKVRQRFKDVVQDKELLNAIDDRIGKFQTHMTILEEIAEKELIDEPRTDKEYAEILYIGRIVEHFILIMNSISPDHDEYRALSNPDSIQKIVYVQSALDGTKLYEGLGPANEINVAVPFYGRRQIVKGPVYSYYEFRSQETWNNERWKKEYDKKNGLPLWIKDYYEGTETRSLQRE